LPYASRKRLECLIFVAPPGSDATAEKIAGCAKNVTASCEQATDRSPSCAIRGTRPVGAACAVAAQCASGSCSRRREERCGKCEPPPPPKQAGETCGVDEDCGPA
jgi:hypothetical protein